MKLTSNLVSKFVGLILTTALSAPAFLPTITVAQEARSDFDAGRYRINIAGRQRMLTQRMAKAVCFIHEGFDVDMHVKMLADDHVLFTNTLDTLLNGGGKHDLEPETDRRTLEELGHVSKQWEHLSEIILRAIETGTVSDEDEEYVLGFNSYPILAIFTGFQ